jgi:hypothetical protein
MPSHALYFPTLHTSNTIARPSEMSTTTELELVVFEQEHISPNSTAQTDKSSEDVTFAFVQANANIITATPDGGYGWAIVASYAVGTFWHSGTATSWGILQAALPDSTLRDIPTATVSWVGSLGLGCIAFGLFAIPLMKWLGSKTRSLLGVVLMGAGLLASGFSTSNLAGLFGTSGVLFGIGGGTDLYSLQRSSRAIL